MINTLLILATLTGLSMANPSVRWNVVIPMDEDNPIKLACGQTFTFPIIFSGAEFGNGVLFEVFEIDPDTSDVIGGNKESTNNVPGQGATGQFTVTCSPTCHVLQNRPGEREGLAPKIAEYGVVTLDPFQFFSDKLYIECDPGLEVQPPPLPGGFGDPHFRTWSGQTYDFHGECDLVLADAPLYANRLGLTVHLRTTIRYDYSFIEGAAIQIGDDILEVRSWGEYFLNGVSGAEMPYSVSGFSVHYTCLSEKDHRFVIQLEPGEEILVRSFKDMVSLKFKNIISENLRGALGMMGEFGTGTLLARDGSTILEEPNAFGQEWQTRDGDPSLFQTLRLPQYPQPCRFPDNDASASRRRLGEGISRKAAEQACAGWKLEKSECVHDVMATGDLELAQLGEF